MSKENIFQVALELVSEHGTDVSVRQISKAAGVNVAAISYHFGNKDNLIYEIIKYQLDYFKEAFDDLENTEHAPIDRLELFICKLISLIQLHSEVVEYVIEQQDLFKTRYEYQRYLEEIGYQKLVNLISEITGIEDEMELTVIIEHIFVSSLWGYITELRLTKRNSEFVADIDYKYRVKVFIENYFYKYIEREEG